MVGTHTLLGEYRKRPRSELNLLHPPYYDKGFITPENLDYHAGTKERARLGFTVETRAGLEVDAEAGTQTTKLDERRQDQSPRMKTQPGAAAKSRVRAFHAPGVPGPP